MKKIFIADDDEAIVDATSMMLEMVGYEVSYTLNGAAIQLAAENKPDLILLDIWMSGIDGRDVCRIIKATPPNQRHSGINDICQQAYPRISLSERG